MVPNHFSQYWHGSLVTNGKQAGILVVGSPGVGKSDFCYYLLESLNYYLVADDLVRLIKFDTKYEGILCNKRYYGVIHHKQKGFIKVVRALRSSVVSHVVYLFQHEVEEKYLNKAQSLMLPVIVMDVKSKSWDACATQLQNILE
ncbi:hypothetical protein [Caedibacter taeniospiralis]|jgi:serine kinase of HPr protein (carbohydrate metabolism regulator)|uniref:hypothetical protein n=1 Tax=Caedibacter taeniospiralis TaxID=28907 RepID=UPI0037C138FC